MDTSFMDFSYFVVMFMVALVAGFINVVSGGGGFLSIGALLISGLPPANALATNKIQALGSSLTSGIYFLRRGYINVQEHKYVFLSAFIGSALGTTLIQFIEPELLKKLLPILIIAVAIYFIFAPNLSEPKRKQQVSLFLFSLIGGGCIGFYDGFLGAGAGSFYTLSYILLWGYSIDKAQIHSNFINLASNIASILFFIFGGKMIWSLGLVMFAGQSLGARLGATVVLTRGKKVIRPMIVIVSICISIKMLLDMY
ncbi:TSUP family transporter [Citrobacter freundii]|nr:TSUP family transporter [Citrobacter freundii]